MAPMKTVVVFLFSLFLPLEPLEADPSWEPVLTEPLNVATGEGESFIDRDNEVEPLVSGGLESAYEPTFDEEAWERLGSQSQALGLRLAEGYGGQGSDYAQMLESTDFRIHEEFNIRLSIDSPFWMSPDGKLEIGAPPEWLEYMGSVNLVVMTCSRRLSPAQYAHYWQDKSCLMLESDQPVVDRLDIFWRQDGVDQFDQELVLMAVDPLAEAHGGLSPYGQMTAVTTVAAAEWHSADLFRPAPSQLGVEGVVQVAAEHDPPYLSVFQVVQRPASVIEETQAESDPGNPCFLVWWGGIVTPLGAPAPSYNVMPPFGYDKKPITKICGFHLYNDFLRKYANRTVSRYELAHEIDRIWGFLTDDFLSFPYPAATTPPVTPVSIDFQKHSFSDGGGYSCGRTVLSHGSKQKRITVEIGLYDGSSPFDGCHRDRQKNPIFNTIAHELTHVAIDLNRVSWHHHEMSFSSRTSSHLWKVLKAPLWIHEATAAYVEDLMFDRAMNFDVKFREGRALLQGWTNLNGVITPNMGSRSQYVPRPNGYASNIFLRYLAERGGVSGYTPPSIKIDGLFKNFYRATLRQSTLVCNLFEKACHESANSLDGPIEYVTGESYAGVLVDFYDKLFTCGIASGVDITADLHGEAHGERNPHHLAGGPSNNGAYWDQFVCNSSSGGFERIESYRCPSPASPTLQCDDNETEDAAAKIHLDIPSGGKGLDVYFTHPYAWSHRLAGTQQTRSKMGLITSSTNLQPGGVKRLEFIGDHALSRSRSDHSANSKAKVVISRNGHDSGGRGEFGSQALHGVFGSPENVWLYPMLQLHSGLSYHGFSVEDRRTQAFIDQEKARLQKENKGPRTLKLKLYLACGKDSKNLYVMPTCRHLKVLIYTVKNGEPAQRKVYNLEALRRAHYRKTGGQNVVPLEFDIGREDQSASLEEVHVLLIDTATIEDHNAAILFGKNKPEYAYSRYFMGGRLEFGEASCPEGLRQTPHGDCECDTDNRESGFMDHNEMIGWQPNQYTDPNTGAETCVMEPPCGPTEYWHKSVVGGGSCQSCGGSGQFRRYYATWEREDHFLCVDCIRDAKSSASLVQKWWPKGSTPWQRGVTNGVPHRALCDCPNDIEQMIFDKQDNDNFTGAEVDRLLKFRSCMFPCQSNELKDAGISPVAPHYYDTSISGCSINEASKFNTKKCCKACGMPAGVLDDKVYPENFIFSNPASHKKDFYRSCGTCPSSSTLVMANAPGNSFFADSCQYGYNPYIDQSRFYTGHKTQPVLSTALCPAGSSRSGLDGRQCICADGTKLPAPWNQQCASSCVDHQTYSGTSLKCECQAPAEWDNGKCLCKKGHVFDGAQCVCPSGTEKVNGQCVAKCQSNQVRLNGVCYELAGVKGCEMDVHSLAYPTYSDPHYTNGSCTPEMRSGAWQAVKTFYGKIVNGHYTYANTPSPDATKVTHYCPQGYKHSQICGDDFRYPPICTKSKSAQYDGKFICPSNDPASGYCHPSLQGLCKTGTWQFFYGCPHPLSVKTINGYKVCQ